MRSFPHSLFMLTLLLAGNAFSALPTSAQTPPTLRAPMRAIVTTEGAYLPGMAQMIAPARANRVLLHPQGRYALIVQNEVSPPPGALIGKPETGASSLLLYDARLNKTKVLWEGSAESGRTLAGYNVGWLTGTDCAVAVVMEAVPTLNKSVDLVYKSALLFFNFEKGSSARTLLTTMNDVTLKMSPSKPLYMLVETDFSGEPGSGMRQIRLGTARGTMGTPVPTASSLYWSDWSTEGTTIYGAGMVTVPPTAPEDKPQRIRRWYAWDGQATEPMLLPARPSVAQLAKEIPPAVLPFALQSSVLAVPLRTKDDPSDTLHPLYLEATDTPVDAPNHSVRIAPDTDASYLLADKSAVLYQSEGALYSVPLVRLNRETFAEVQKAALKRAAISNAKQLGLGILGYIQDDDEKFPLQASFATVIQPYIKNADLLQGFTYVYPGLNQAGIENVAQTVMGYVTGPGGRAILYTDGHVKWEDAR